MSNRDVADRLVEMKNYEDFLFFYIMKKDSLPPFFEYIKEFDIEDRENIMQYITLSKKPISISLRKLLNSPFFFQTVEIDKFLK